MAGSHWVLASLFFISTLICLSGEQLKEKLGKLCHSGCVETGPSEENPWVQPCVASCLTVVNCLEEKLMGEHQGSAQGSCQQLCESGCRQMEFMTEAGTMGCRKGCTVLADLFKGINLSVTRLEKPLNILVLDEYVRGAANENETMTERVESDQQRQDDNRTANPKRRITSNISLTISARKTGQRGKMKSSFVIFGEMGTPVGFNESLRTNQKEWLKNIILSLMGNVTRVGNVTTPVDAVGSKPGGNIGGNPLDERMEELMKRVEVLTQMTFTVVGRKESGVPKEGAVEKTEDKVSGGGKLTEVSPLASNKELMTVKGETINGGEGKKNVTGINPGESPQNMTELEKKIIQEPAGIKEVKGKEGETKKPEEVSPVGSLIKLLKNKNQTDPIQGRHHNGTTEVDGRNVKGLTAGEMQE